MAKTEPKDSLDVKQPAATRVRWKGDISFRHDLFKLEVADMLKNTNWDVKNPNYVPLAHVHIFHSHSSQGEVQDTTNKVGGHFHFIEYDRDTMVAKCGPAMTHKETKLKNGRRRVDVVKIRLPDPQTGEYTLEDNHTHPVTYLHSEVLGPNILKAREEEDKARLMAMPGALQEVKTAQLSESDLNPKGKNPADTKAGAKPEPKHEATNIQDLDGDLE